MANVRSAYATVVTQHLNDGSAHSAVVSAQQAQASWQTSGGGSLQIMNENSGYSTISYVAKTSGNAYTVSISTDGTVKVE